MKQHTNNNKKTPRAYICLLNFNKQKKSWKSLLEFPVCLFTTYTHSRHIIIQLLAGFMKGKSKRCHYQCIYLKWSVISEITMHVWSFLLFSPTILYLLLVWKIKISTNCWSILSDGFYVNWFCLQNFWNMLLFAVTFNRIFFVYFFSSIVN